MESKLEYEYIIDYINSAFFDNEVCRDQLVCFISFYLSLMKILHKLKDKHPDWPYGETYWADKAHFLVQIAIISLCPILNLLFIYICIFKFDELCKNSIENAEHKMKSK